MAKTTKKEKAPNYTNEQTAELVAAYVAVKTPEERSEVVETFANKLGKSTRSIVSKLSRESVYIKKTYQTKTGAKAVTKSKLVQDIAAAMGLNEESLNGMENATKGALQKVLAFVVASNLREGSE